MTRALADFCYTQRFEERGGARESTRALIREQDTRRRDMSPAATKRAANTKVVTLCGWEPD
jgi:hypothetical protein